MKEEPVLRAMPNAEQGEASEGRSEEAAGSAFSSTEVALLCFDG